MHFMTDLGGMMFSLRGHRCYKNIGGEKQLHQRLSGNRVVIHTDTSTHQTGNPKTH